MLRLAPIILTFGIRPRNNKKLDSGKVWKVPKHKVRSSGLNWWTDSKIIFKLFNKTY